MMEQLKYPFAVLMFGEYLNIDKFFCNLDSFHEASMRKNSHKRFLLN